MSQIWISRDSTFMNQLFWRNLLSEFCYSFNLVQENITSYYIDILTFLHSLKMTPKIKKVQELEQKKLFGKIQFRYIVLFPPWVVVFLVY